MHPGSGKASLDYSGRTLQYGIMRCLASTRRPGRRDSGAMLGLIDLLSGTLGGRCPSLALGRGNRPEAAELLIESGRWSPTSSR
jgi:hypothetical protein